MTRLSKSLTNKTPWAVVALTLFGLCSIPTSHADDKHNGSISVIFENDTFGGSDNNYSNGVGLTWTSSEIGAMEDDAFAKRYVNFWSFLPGVDSAERSYLSFTLAQEMHTPDDIEVANPPLDDQPYAGIAYVDTVIHTRKGRSGQAWSLRLGVVGPESQADHTQAWVHREIDGDRPLGWREQLPNEGIINFGYTAGYVWKTSEPDERFDWRLVPMVNAELGNYVTAAGGGLYFEIGRNLSPALATSGLGRGFNSTFTAGPAPGNEWSFSFFAGVSAYAVGHYLPLDGTVFRDSRSVDSNDFVGIANWGFSVRRGQFAASLAANHFTETFETERQNVDFGNITLAWYF